LRIDDRSPIDLSRVGSPRPIVSLNDPSSARTAEATARHDMPRRIVAHLRHGSALLERRIERDGLLIVGAEYCVEAGTVEFFDD